MYYLYYLYIPLILLILILLIYQIIYYLLYARDIFGGDCGAAATQVAFLLVSGVSRVPFDVGCGAENLSRIGRRITNTGCVNVEEFWLEVDVDRRRQTFQLQTLVILVDGALLLSLAPRPAVRRTGQLVQYNTVTLQSQLSLATFCCEI